MSDDSSVFKSNTPGWLTPPKDTPEFMHGAWVSCLSWAVGYEPICKQFEEATGVKWAGPRHGIDVLIDAACGHSPVEDYFRAFVPWFNKQIWGSMDDEISIEE